jgi:hypothetical protein
MSWLDAGIVTIGSQCASHVRISITECDPVERWISGRHGSRCRALARNLWHLVPHGELHRLASDIDRLHRDLAGRIEFQPLEPYLELTLVGDGRGHIFIRGKANDLSSDEHSIAFSLHIDQTELPAIARALRTADPA